MTSSDSEVDAVYMEEVEETPGAENEFSELTGGSSNVPKGPPWAPQAQRGRNVNPTLGYVGNVHFL